MKEGLPVFLTTMRTAPLRCPQIRISVLVCNEVDGILQNRLDGKPGERTPVFCFDALPQQFGLSHGQGIVLLVEVENFVDDLCFVRQQLELAGLLVLPSTVMLLTLSEA